MNLNPNTAPKPAPIGNINEAERAIANLNTIMDRLVETVEQETARVRSAACGTPYRMTRPRSSSPRAYAAESERVKAAKGIIAKELPDALERLRQRHDAFRALLQTNLTSTGHVACRVRRHHPRRLRRTGAKERAVDLQRHRPRQYAGSKTSQPLAFSQVALALLSRLQARAPKNVRAAVLFRGQPSRLARRKKRRQH